MLDKIQSPLIDTSLAPVKGAISNSDYVFVRGADESIEKVLVSDLLAGTAGAIRIRGEADMDNVSTTPTSVVIIGDPNNATMEQGVAPVDTSPNGVSYVVKTAQSGVQTQISGTVQTVFDGDQIIWSGSKWSILALGNAVTSVDTQTGAVNLEDKYYWTGNKPNIGDIPNLQGTLDSKYSPANKPTPAEIGAKANSYIPDWEEITNKPDTSTRWPSFAEVTGKPSTFTPSAHTHTAAQVSGLGTAATANITTSTTDTTTGRVLKVGDFGIGKIGTLPALPVSDLNDLTINGTFSVGGGTANWVFGNFGGVVQQVMHGDNSYITQIAYSSTDDNILTRTKINTTTWTAWKGLLYTGNLLQSIGTSTTFPMSQKAVTDQLATKAALSHSHPWSQVTGAPAQATRWPTFDEVTGKPTTFPPSSHNHDTLYYTKAQSDGRYPQKSEFGSGTAWAGIVNKYVGKINSDGILEIGKNLDFHDIGSMDTSGRLYIVNDITGFAFTKRLQIAAGIGNDYAQGSLEVLGNTSAGIYPSIGFHQPGIFGGSLQQRGIDDFRFYQLGLSKYASVSCRTLKAFGEGTSHYSEMRASTTANEYIFGGTGSNGTSYLRIGNNKFQYTYPNGTTYNVYHQGYKPTKSDVGLSNVPNYTISHATNDPSTNKFASTAAVYSVSQRVATLESGGSIPVYKSNDPYNSDFPIGTTLMASVDGSPISRNEQVYMFLEGDNYSFVASPNDGEYPDQLYGIWGARGYGGNGIQLFQRIM